MYKDNLFKSVIEGSYSVYSNILLFGFTEYEKEISKDITNNMIVEDKNKNNKAKINIYDTEVMTDIFAIPYFIAFINFKKLSEEDMNSLFEFYIECEEPIPIEFEKEFSETDNTDPLIYAINYEKNSNKKIPACIKIANNIFNDKENLRLTILSELKNIEGLGIASSNSNRIYRVLQMYKLLIYKGALNKKMVDELIYPEKVSQRMFFNDIRIIKYVEEGNLKYDRKLKVYKIKK